MMPFGKRVKGRNVLMESVLRIVQIVSGVLLIGAVLLQQRGSGLGAAFGGGGEAYHTRRGIEKFLFIGTVILGTLFLASGLLQVI